MSSDRWKTLLVWALIAGAGVQAIASTPQAPAAAPAPAPAAAMPAAVPDDYVVSTQDILTVSVFGQAQLSGKYVVEADGTISFPMLGRVRVGGLGARDVERELTRQLGNGYFRDPQVTVGVERYRVQQIFVMGEVRTPGAFPLTGGMSVLEALARAGSTTPDAGDEAIIMRPLAAEAAPAAASAAIPGAAPVATPDSSQSTVIRIDLVELSRGALAFNVPLQSGDTLVVKRVDTVFVSGQVKSPGTYPARRGTTVLQVISMAGGPTDRGSTGRVRITRIVNGKPQQVRVGLGDPVLPGDTIIVLERIL